MTTIYPETTLTFDILTALLKRTGFTIDAYLNNVERFECEDFVWQTNVESIDGPTLSIFTGDERLPTAEIYWNRQHGNDFSFTTNILFPAEQNLPFYLNLENKVLPHLAAIEKDHMEMIELKYPGTEVFTDDEEDFIDDDEEVEPIYRYVRPLELDLSRHELQYLPNGGISFQFVLDHVKDTLNFTYVRTPNDVKFCQDFSKRRLRSRFRNGLFYTFTNYQKDLPLLENVRTFCRLVSDKKLHELEAHLEAILQHNDNANAEFARFYSNASLNIKKDYDL